MRDSVCVLFLVSHESTPKSRVPKLMELCLINQEFHDTPAAGGAGGGGGCGGGGGRGVGLESHTLRIKTAGLHQSLWFHSIPLFFLFPLP